MGFLQNTWLRYADRSYEQIKAAVLTRMQSRVPEMTDHTESNLFVKIVSIFAAIAEMLGYYTDNAAREAHLDSCRLYASGISHARRSDYRVRGKLAANCEVKFYLENPAAEPVNILSGTLLRCSDSGISFITTTNTTIAAGATESALAGARQLEARTDVPLGIGTGLPNQELIISDDVADSSVVLRINNVSWDRCDTLAFSMPTDLHYMETVNKNGEHVVIFGDGVNGAIPATGLAIIGDYKATAGATGNVEVGSIDTIESGGLVGLKVTNPVKAVGGSDVESLDQLKRRIPKALRTLDRAVTPADYIDIAELAPAVAKAGLVFTEGTTIDLYIVPDGGGLATQVLLADVEEFFRTKKIIGRQVRVFAAGEVRVKLSITVNAYPNYRNVDVENALRQRLMEFVSYQHQEIQGELHLGDIYERLETYAGTKNSKVESMTTVPYARPLEENTPQLNWNKEVKQGSERPIDWKIVILALDELTGAVSYQLYKATGYIGDFVSGQPIVLPEIDFTLLPGPYTVGDQWSFYTYPYFGTLQLQEPSIPVLYAEDVQLIVKGGL